MGPEYQHQLDDLLRKIEQLEAVVRSQQQTIVSQQQAIEVQQERIKQLESALAASESALGAFAKRGQYFLRKTLENKGEHLKYQSERLIEMIECALKLSDVSRIIASRNVQPLSYMRISVDY